MRGDGSEQLRPRPVSLHRRWLKRADIVEVDINRQPVETEMKDIERRAALESEPVTQDSVARYFLQDIEQPEYLFERPGLMTGIVSNALKRLERGRRHSQPLEPAFYDVDGQDYVPAL